ncbi:putative aspartyl-trna synthetase, partial [Diplocarpon rosae]
RLFKKREARLFIKTTLKIHRTAVAGLRIPHPRCFHQSERRQVDEAEAAEPAHIDEPAFFKLYKNTLEAPVPKYAFKKIERLLLDKRTVAVGFLTSIRSISDDLVFGELTSGHKGTQRQVQIICRGEMCRQLKSIRLNTPVNVAGVLAYRRPSKKSEEKSHNEVPFFLEPSQVEIIVSNILPLNYISPNLHINPGHIYPPQSRHLQLRFDEPLRQRLYFRAMVAESVRQTLGSFHEIDTPILFKSTPEGAREFLVPTRKAGFAYALPQSPQQYKQILMASGINRYFQFAKCFRDEDLRADRQPEFTQIDIEMAFATGEDVMQAVEALISDIYRFCSPERMAKWRLGLISPLDSQPCIKFYRMRYFEAMTIHGSDKPDLRINAPIIGIEYIVPDELSRMITSIEKPIIEIFKIRLDASPREVQDFIRRFMESPEAEVFRSNIDGAPGICVYDSSKPLHGLQTFGFEAAKQLKDQFLKRSKRKWENDEAYEISRTFEDGDLFILQAREKLPFSGGSTALGRLRSAIYRAALAEKLIKPDKSHHYTWVTDFPMFTLNDSAHPGQGGSAGFSATHHPFTAPKLAKDADLLLTDPLKATADHYDLVVNGIELGGGSRRIHNADMQRFIMRNILKMSEARIENFAHLFSALESGCPPHAGFAIGFDRLVAVLTGHDSVKEVIAFPKSSKGEDMMIKSPSMITDAELATYHLALTGDKKGAADFQSPKPDVVKSPAEIETARKLVDISPNETGKFEKADGLEGSDLVTPIIVETEEADIEKDEDVNSEHTLSIAETEETDSEKNRRQI